MTNTAARRCLICANINPCAAHSDDQQRTELARNDRAIADLRAPNTEARSLDERELRECPNPWCDATTTPAPFFINPPLSGQGVWRVKCGCGIRGPYALTSSDAREAWNRRALTPTPGEKGLSDSQDHAPAADAKLDDRARTLIAALRQRKWPCPPDLKESDPCKVCGATVENLKGCPGPVPHPLGQEAADLIERLARTSTLPVQQTAGNSKDTDEPSNHDLAAGVRLEGWKLAPLEAIEAMLEAAWTDTQRATADERMAMELCDSKTAFKLKMARRYRAMLAAAPPPPVQQTDSEGEG